MDLRWMSSLLLVFLVGFLQLSDADNEDDKERFPRLPLRDLNVAVEVAEDYVRKLYRLEKNLVASGIEVRHNSPSHGQLLDSYPSDRSRTMGKNAFIANRASLYLLQKYCQQSNIPKGICVEAMTRWNSSGTIVGDKCESQFATLKCDEWYPYRTYDGSCNHLSHPSWGFSSTAYVRLLPPDYADGIWQPRRSTSRKPLPSPRLISSSILSDFDKPEKERTLALVQWTQFVGNDLFHTPVSEMFHMNKGIECCAADGKALTPRYVHPICQSISIPVDDPDYSRHRTVCMNYVRSLTSMPDDCTFGPADQMNQNTHYLDGSMIYGSDTLKALSLRAKKGGMLLTVNQEGEEFLPVSDEFDNENGNMEDGIWYKSGDVRANQHPHQTAMYTLWVREHNRVAKLLSKMNPHWGDEVLYQEARRIVIAEIQHITYKYWIPLVLGEKYSRMKDLSVQLKGFSTFFSENMDPRISNSFATVGFRFINSMFQSNLRLYDENNKLQDYLILRDHFNKPSVIQKPDMFERLVRGFSLQTSQKMDASFVKDVTNYLFRSDKNEMGQDIASLDIQRSRDHGLPGYNAFRKFCNLTSDDKFETFLDSMSLTNLNKIKLIYNHPNDVDLLVGALFETPKDDGLLGPVFQCIIGNQMMRTRLGDRYFYDVKGKHHSFKEGQLRELKKATLSRIICDNVVGIEQIQYDAFRLPSSINPMLDCNDPLLLKPNLNEWKSYKKELNFKRKFYPRVKGLSRTMNLVSSHMKSR